MIERDRVTGGGVTGSGVTGGEVTGGVREGGVREVCERCERKSVWPIY